MIKFPKNPCAICRTNEVTQLCDFVVGYTWTTDKDNFGNKMDTCDLPMCSTCSHSYHYGGYDFCPYHFKMLEIINNPDKVLKKRKNDYWCSIVFKENAKLEKESKTGNEEQLKLWD